MKRTIIAVGATVLALASQSVFACQPAPATASYGSAPSAYAVNTMYTTNVMYAPNTANTANTMARTWRLYARNGSGVKGLVRLSAARQGAMVAVTAQGLRAGARYVSLTYDNRACALQPYSAQDVVGRAYFANMRGMGSAMGHSPDSLSMIRSVSVRRASDFKLLACAYAVGYSGY